MKEMIDKQQIAQLLSKFMDGETNVAEEQTLAQYFRTNEVDDEWLEFKEMFALFDDSSMTARSTSTPIPTPLPTSKKLIATSCHSSLRLSGRSLR